MKKFLLRFLLLAGLVLLILIGLFVYSLMPMNLDMSGAEASNNFVSPGGALKENAPEVSLSILKTGKMLSQQMFSWRGGKFGVNQDFGMAAILVKHPRGTFLFDSGFGKNVDEHVKTMPWLMQKLTTYVKEIPAVEQLQKGGIAPEQISAIYISHSHWDHISGLEDFPGVEVRMPAEEFEFIRQHRYSGLIDRFIDKLKVKTFEFTDRPYENFARSYDLYEDGSVVFVPLPGHTEGSAGMFVNLPSGKRFFFTGDLTWAIEGIQLPAERPWMARRLVDYDEAEVRRSIIRVHQLMKRYPEMVIVPAHDRRVHDTIAAFPEFEH
jgi:glyoxylase-like metal-dependent hydrolase (beta-lactamase superfamily II)